MFLRRGFFSVGELRNLLTHSPSGFNAMEWMAGRAASPSDLLSAFTDLTCQKIDSLTFSEIRQIMEGVQEVNAALFFVVEKLGMVEGFILEMRGRASSGLQQP